MIYPLSHCQIINQIMLRVMVWISINLWCCHMLFSDSSLIVVCVFSISFPFVYFLFIFFMLFWVTVLARISLVSVCLSLIPDVSIIHRWKSWRKSWILHKVVAISLSTTQPEFWSKPKFLFFIHRIDRGEKNIVTYEPPIDAQQVKECGILSCRPSFLQKYANIKVIKKIKFEQIENFSR